MKGTPVILHAVDSFFFSFTILARFSVVLCFFCSVNVFVKLQ